MSAVNARRGGDDSRPAQDRRGRRGRARRRRPSRRRRRRRGGCARTPGSTPTVDGQRPPQRRRALAVPRRQQHGGERRRAGVPGRERRRQRPAHRVAGIALGGRSRPAEQALEALVDDQALGAEGERQHRDLGGAAVAGQAARDVDDVPDQAEVAELGGRRRSRCRRPGCRGPARGRRRPSGRSGRSPARTPSGRARRRPGAGPPAVGRRRGGGRRSRRGRRDQAGRPAAPAPRRAARSGSPPNAGHHGWKLHAGAQRARAGPEVVGLARPARRPARRRSSGS